jgi:flagellar protein FliS
MEQKLTESKSGTSTKDSVKIISMLYDGAVNFTRVAKSKIEIGDSAGRTLYIKKTSAIVKELSDSLNMDGGEIAGNLQNLYAFVLESLIKADSQNDLKAINEAERVICILKDAWDEMQTSLAV